jgi:hypothetical protein
VSIPTDANATKPLRELFSVVSVPMLRNENQLTVSLVENRQLWDSRKPVRTWAIVWIRHQAMTGEDKAD